MRDILKKHLSQFEKIRFITKVFYAVGLAVGMNETGKIKFAVCWFITERFLPPNIRIQYVLYSGIMVPVSWFRYHGFSLFYL